MSDRTPGRWCQFHGDYCEEAKGTDYRQWDTSHDVSAILPDGTRYKVAHFRHASDAAFVEKLVNSHDETVATITELRAERDRLAGEVERMRKALGQWDALIEELPSGEDGLTGKQVDRMCRIFNEARARAALQGETQDGGDDE